MPEDKTGDGIIGQVADITRPLCVSMSNGLCPRDRARNLLDRQSVALYDLWLTYWSYGGNAEILEFEALIYGMLIPTEMDFIQLECAVRDTHRS
ncbi:hypothetical protein ACVWY0_002553 [Arthrobacter sp. UYNi723]